MRSRLLRTIFPDRGATTLSKQVPPPVQGAGALGYANLTHAFSQLSLPLGNTQSNGVAQPDGQLPELFDTVSKNLDRLRAITESQVTETQTNTAALSTNTAAKEASQALSAVNRGTGGLLGGLTALPLVSGLLQLFGGGSSTAQRPAPLPKYVAPAKLSFDEALRSGSEGGESDHIAYDRFGHPRTNRTETPPVPDYASLISIARSNSDGVVNSNSGTPGTTAVTQSPASTGGATNTSHVTVNIQAMDSRSFLDRSQDIAHAVREAMLNMHSINDVVNDL